MTWEAYAKAQADPAWREVRDRYLSRKAGAEISAQQTWLDRMSDIDEMYRIEKEYEENQ